MFRTISARALGLCLRSGQSFQSLEVSAPLYAAQHRMTLAPLSSSASRPFRVSPASPRPLFPTAASDISCRLFHGHSFLSCSAGRTRTLDQDDDAADSFAHDEYIDLDDAVDFRSSLRKGDVYEFADPSDFAGRTSAKSVTSADGSKMDFGRGVRSSDDEEVLGLNRRQRILDDDDDVGEGLKQGVDVDRGRSVRPVLPESLTTLLGSLRSQATTHNEELETSRSEHAASGVSFEDFGLEPSLLARLGELNYGTPFEVQAKTMKALMDGKNVVGQAVTGSGKTLAFGIPLVNALIKGRDGRQRRPSSQPKALILTPTRELCNQITKAISELDSKVKCLAVYGGRPLTSDMSNLQRGVDVVCATPGRLRDLIRRKSISLDRLEFLVLDEADEMLKDAWIEDLEDILEGSPPEKQAILFSATMPPEIYKVAENFLQRQLEVIRVKDVESDDNAPSAVNHLSLYVPRRDQERTAKEIISFYEPKSTIVFVPTRDGTNRVADEIRRMGIRDVQVLQGGMSQTHRDRTLDGFRTGRFSVLVATDVVARGIDIPNVELIIQMGLPQGVHAYLHRSGRTGRAGKAGLAILIHSALKQELDFVRDLKRKVKNLMEEDLGERPYGRRLGHGDDEYRHRDHSYGESRGGRGDRWGGGVGGHYQRRDVGYGGGGNYNQRGGDRGDYGFRPRGGGRGGADFDSDSGEFRFQPRQSDGGGGRGGGDYGGDRRSRFDDDDFLDEDEFGSEKRSAASRRRSGDRRPQERSAPSWMRDDDLQRNFDSFLAKRQSTGGAGGARRSARKDEDYDF